VQVDQKKSAHARTKIVLRYSSYFYSIVPNNDLH